MNLFAGALFEYCGYSRACPILGCCRFQVLGHILQWLRVLLLLELAGIRCCQGRFVFVVGPVFYFGAGQKPFVGNVVHIGHYRVVCIRLVLVLAFPCWGCFCCC